MRRNYHFWGLKPVKWVVCGSSTHCISITEWVWTLPVAFAMAHSPQMLVVLSLLKYIANYWIPEGQIVQGKQRVTNYPFIQTSMWIMQASLTTAIHSSNQANGLCKQYSVQSTIYSCNQASCPFILPSKWNMQVTLTTATHSSDHASRLCKNIFSVVSCLFI